MIIVSVGCGLGNQMFQYAYVAKLKKQYPEQEIKIDISYSFPKAHNGYELEEVFNITLEKCTDAEYEAMDVPEFRQKTKIGRNITRVWVRMKKEFKGGPIFIQQRDHTCYYSKLLHLRNNKSYYIKGVFANDKYFKDMKEQVIKDFTFPAIEGEENLKWAEKIKEAESCSIHIRRGDYVSEGVALLQENYYFEAMRTVEKKSGKKVYFFAFTDDIHYVKQIFGRKRDVSIIEGNVGEKSYIDMQLMSLCKHNIIANSSFSFWGAYLNKNPNKIVVSSKQPFTGCRHPFTTDEWIKL